MMRIGLIGLDSSHARSLAQWYRQNAEGVARAIGCAWPGGTAGVPLSEGRVADFTREMRDDFGVALLGTPEEVAARSDALALLTMDGRTHAELFVRIAGYRRRIFITKPLTTTSADAQAIARCAEANSVDWFAASALRFCQPPTELARTVHVTCPLWFEPANVGWSWYGVHGIELVYASMGAGVESVAVDVQADREVARLSWRDGREARVTGWLSREAPFTRCRDGGPTENIPVEMESLEQQIDAFFLGAPSPVPVAEMLEVVRCVEAVNESRARDGAEVRL